MIRYRFENSSGIVSEFEHGIKLSRQERLSFEQIRHLLLDDGVALEPTPTIRYTHPRIGACVLLKEGQELNTKDPINLIIKLSADPNRSKLTSLQQKLQKLQERQPSKSIRRQARSRSIIHQVDLLDVAVLFAAPLVHAVGDHVESLATTDLIWEENRRDLISMLEAQENIKSDFQAATFNNLETLLSLKPKVLHIHCHIVLHEGAKHLAFESQMQPGLISLVSQEDLSALQTEYYFNGVLVITSRMAREVGKFFSKAGFPSVIKVNLTAPNLTEAPKHFLTKFYAYLLQGKTLNDAYLRALEQAQDILDNNKVTNHFCCCQHTHTNNCQWFAKYFTSTSLLLDEAHIRHEPACNFRKCTKDNYMRNIHHSFDCGYRFDFENEFGIQPDEESQDLTMDDIRICCCKPTLHHDNRDDDYSKKFQFSAKFKEPGLLDRVYFNPRAQRKSLDDNEGNIRPPLPENTILIGRNIEIAQYMRYFMNNDIRLITLNGENGIGKTLFIKLVAFYAYERQIFDEGVIYIELKGKLDPNLIIYEILRYLDLPDLRESEFYEYIREKSLLIILDSLDSMIEHSEIQLNKVICELIDATRELKIVIVSTMKFEIKHRSIRTSLNSLKSQDAMQLFLTLLTKTDIPVSQDLRKRIMDPNERGHADIKKLFKPQPSEIRQVVTLIKNYDRFEKYQTSFEQEAQQHNKGENVPLSMSIDGLKQRPGALDLLYYICFIPRGVFAFDLDVLLGKGAWEANMDFLSDKAGKSSNSMQLINREWLTHREEFFTPISSISKTVILRAQKEERGKEIKLACLQHFATMSRALCIAMPKSFQHLGILLSTRYTEFNAIAGRYMWAPMDVLYSTDMSQQILTFPMQRFKGLDGNFVFYLEPKRIVKFLEYGEEAAPFLGELMICTASFYLILGPNYYQNSLQIVGNLSKCKKFQHSDQLADFIAKYAPQLRLIGAYSHFLAQNYRKALKSAEKALSLFVAQECKEGQAECYCLIGQMWKHVHLPSWGEGLSNAGDFFSRANTLFQESEIALGQARSTFYACSKNLEDNTHSSQTLQNLEWALKIFQEHNLVGWEFQSYIAMANFHEKTENMSDCKKILSQAHQVSVEAKDREQERILSRRISLIYEQMVKSSRSVICLLKAWPLLETTVVGTRRVTGSLTKIPSKFRQELLEKIRSVDKSIKIKFQIATLSNLMSTFEKGARILHLSSELVSETHLILEDENCLADKISLKDLEDLRSGHTRFQLGGIKDQGLDVVVFAMPLAEKIAKVFTDKLNVPHVIFFNFPNFSYSIDGIMKKQKIEEYINAFCIEFYSLLTTGHTVKNAFDKSREIVKNDRRFEHTPEEGPVLLNAESSHHLVPLFTDQEHLETNALVYLPPGSWDEMSTLRCPTNLEKRSCNFTGRAMAIHDAVTNLKQYQCVNILGIQGIGKTEFLHQVGYHFYMRNDYPGGIYYVNLECADTMRDFLEKVKEETNCDYNNKGVLLILDNLDKLIRSQPRKLLIWMKHYMESVGLNIIFASVAEIKVEGREMIKEQTLEGLQPDEITSMILSNWDPDQISYLDKENLYSGQNFSQWIPKVRDVRLARGKPAKLRELIDNMNSGDFDYPTLDYLPSLVGMDSVIDQDYLKARSATLPVVQVPALPAVHVEPPVEDEEFDDNFFEIPSLVTGKSIQPEEYY